MTEDCATETLSKHLQFRSFLVTLFIYIALGIFYGVWGWRGGNPRTGCPPKTKEWKNPQCIPASNQREPARTASG